MNKLLYKGCEFLSCIAVGILSIASYDNSPIASAIFMATGLWIAFKEDK